MILYMEFYQGDLRIDLPEFLNRTSNSGEDLPIIPRVGEYVVVNGFELEVVKIIYQPIKTDKLIIKILLK